MTLQVVKKNRIKSFGENNESIIDALIKTLRFSKIKKIIPHNAVVVDFGCGYRGDLLASISEKIDKGIGFDLSVKKKSYKKNIFFRTADLNKQIPIKEKSADVVTLIAILEHIERPKHLLNESYRVLKPGGLLILTTPSISAKGLLEMLAFKFKIISSEEISDHKRYYEPKSLRRELIGAGFKNEDIMIKTFQFGLNIFAKCTK